MKLRQYQTEAVDAAYDSLKSGRGNPLIDLPTGSGKSLTLAEIARRAVTDYAGRVVILAHRKELLSQNAAKIQALCNIPVGMYSSGLNERSTDQPIIVGGIQSIYNKAHELGRRHLAIIDEAHLCARTDDGMYRTFLADLARYNPKLKVVGLTATPYRLDSGRLWGPDELFSHVCYRGDIRWMIEQGYLCNLVNKPSSTLYDTSGLHIRGGEFIRREVEDLFADDALAVKACEELVAKAVDRKSILVFCSGVENAFKVQEILEKLTSEQVGVVTGETPSLERATTLEAFSAGEFRYCVNVDVLTTGFDSPRIDCVAIMRATQSAGLFCQIVGRGLRTHASKTDCLIVDFGNNLKRHGPIDSVEFGNNKPKSERTGEAPQKTCYGCGEAVPAGLRQCECGFLFTFSETKHETKSDEESQILSEPETFAVTGWQLSRHFKKNNENAPNTLRVTYFVGGDLESAVEEWVCLNHEGFAKGKALKWWAEHSDDNIDELAEALDEDCVGAALHVWLKGYLRRPTEITAIRQGRWWRITGRVVGEVEGVQVEEEIPF
jgi:DNA repair protein RadD